MDEWLWEAITNSELSEHFQDVLTKYLRKYFDFKNVKYIPVRDSYDIVAKLEDLEKDLNGLNLEDEIYEMFIYHFFRKYSRKNDSLYNEMALKIITNAKLRKKLKGLKRCSSGIVEFYVGAIELIHELIACASRRESFLVLKKYIEFMDYCHCCGINPEIIKNDKQLKTKLEKKYFKASILLNPTEFRKHIEQQDFPKEDEYKPENPIFKNTNHLEIDSMQKALHEIMLEYYRDTGFIVRPYTDNINIYYLKGLVVVAYKYDDVPNMVLRKGELNLTLEDPDFWAKIYNPAVDFIEGDGINYFIDKDNYIDAYRLVPLAFKNQFYKRLGAKVIFVPEMYLEEGIYLGLTENGTIKLDLELLGNLQSWGINLDNLSNKLMTSDYSFFCKNPALIDELDIKPGSDYKYLTAIRSRTGKHREAYIKRLITNAEKNPKKTPKKDISQNPNRAYRMNLQKKRSYVNPDERRNPYKDD